MISKPVFEKNMEKLRGLFEISDVSFPRVEKCLKKPVTEFKEPISWAKLQKEILSDKLKMFDKALEKLYKDKVSKKDL